MNFHTLLCLLRMAWLENPNDRNISFSSESTVVREIGSTQPTLNRGRMSETAMLDKIFVPITDSVKVPNYQKEPDQLKPTKHTLERESGTGKNQRQTVLMLNDILNNMKLTNRNKRLFSATPSCNGNTCKNSQIFFNQHDLKNVYKFFKKLRRPQQKKRNDKEFHKTLHKHRNPNNKTNITEIKTTRTTQENFFYDDINQNNSNDFINYLQTNNNNSNLTLDKFKVNSNASQYFHLIDISPINKCNLTQLVSKMPPSDDKKQPINSLKKNLNTTINSNTSEKIDFVLPNTLRNRPDLPSVYHNISKIYPAIEQEKTSLENSTGLLVTQQHTVNNTEDTDKFELDLNSAKTKEITKKNPKFGNEENILFNKRFVEKRSPGNISMPSNVKLMSDLHSIIRLKRKAANVFWTTLANLKVKNKETGQDKKEMVDTILSSIDAEEQTNRFKRKPDPMQHLYVMRDLRYLPRNGKDNFKKSFNKKIRTKRFAQKIKHNQVVFGTKSFNKLQPKLENRKLKTNGKKLTNWIKTYKNKFVEKPTMRIIKKYQIAKRSIQNSNQLAQLENSNNTKDNSDLYKEKSTLSKEFLLGNDPDQQSERINKTNNEIYNNDYASKSTTLKKYLNTIVNGILKSPLGEINRQTKPLSSKQEEQSSGQLIKLISDEEKKLTRSNKSENKRHLDVRFSQFNDFPRKNQRRELDLIGTYSKPLIAKNGQHQHEEINLESDLSSYSKVIIDKNKRSIESNWENNGLVNGDKEVQSEQGSHIRSYGDSIIDKKARNFESDFSHSTNNKKARNFNRKFDSSSQSTYHKTGRNLDYGLDSYNNFNIDKEERNLDSSSISSSQLTNDKQETNLVSDFDSNDQSTRVKKIKHLGLGSVSLIQSASDKFQSTSDKEERNLYSELDSYGQSTRGKEKRNFVSGSISSVQSISDKEEKNLDSGSIRSGQSTSDKEKRNLDSELDSYGQSTRGKEKRNVVSGSISSVQSIGDKEEKHFDSGSIRSGQSTSDKEKRNLDSELDSYGQSTSQKEGNLGSGSVHSSHSDSDKFQSTSDEERNMVSDPVGSSQSISEKEKRNLGSGSVHSSHSASDKLQSTSDEELVGSRQSINEKEKRNLGSGSVHSSHSASDKLQSTSDEELVGSRQSINEKEERNLGFGSVRSSHSASDKLQSTSDEELVGSRQSINEKEERNLGFGSVRSSHSASDKFQSTSDEERNMVSDPVGSSQSISEKEKRNLGSGSVHSSHSASDKLQSTSDEELVGSRQSINEKEERNLGFGSVRSSHSASDKLQSTSDEELVGSRQSINEKEERNLGSGSVRSSHSASDKLQSTSDEERNMDSDPVGYSQSISEKEERNLGSGSVRSSHFASDKFQPTSDNEEQNLDSDSVGSSQFSSKERHLNSEMDRFGQSISDNEERNLGSGSRSTTSDKEESILGSDLARASQSASDSLRLTRNKAERNLDLEIGSSSQFTSDNKKNLGSGLPGSSQFTSEKEEKTIGSVLITSGQSTSDFDLLNRNSHFISDKGERNIKPDNPNSETSSNTPDSETNVSSENSGSNLSNSSATKEQVSKPDQSPEFNESNYSILDNINSNPVYKPPDFFRSEERRKVPAKTSKEFWMKFEYADVVNPDIYKPFNITREPAHFYEYFL